MKKPISHLKYFFAINRKLQKKKKNEFFPIITQYLRSFYTSYNKSFSKYYENKD